MGHASNNSVQDLVRNQMVRGLEKYRPIGFCDICVQGKQCRNPFNGRRPISSRVLERIHTDICGPFDPITWDGYKYFVSFIDDFSHFAVIYPLRQKSEVFEKLVEYEAMVSSMHNVAIAMITVDQGREYISRQAISFLKEKGIQTQCTIAYSPQQNGVAERFNRTLVERIRVMLLESGIPKPFWGEAALTATYILNRNPCRSINLKKTPAELWYNQKPDVSKLRIFGCKAYAWIPQQKRKKLDAKSVEVVMMGYAPNGYRMWDQSKGKIVIARDVRFNELMYPYKLQNKSSDEDRNYLLIDVANQQEGEDGEICADSVRDTTRENRDGDDGSGCSDDEVEFSDVGESFFESEAGDSEGQPQPRRSERIRNRFMQYISGYSANLNEPREPLTYAEIDKRSDKELWMKAIDEELKSMNENRVWELVPHPPNVKLLKSKWVFRVKEDANGNPVRHKARLVAKGFLQKAGIDYEETYAPVAKLATVRIVLAISVQKGYFLHQLDVKTAFLYGTLKEEIFMAIPEGLQASQGLVCKLQKSLYGLKQSPKCWNEKFNSFLLEYGFDRSKHDYCLYFKFTASNVLYLILYVDDILIAGNNLELIEKLKKELSKIFKMSDCGPLRCYLGTKIDYDQKSGILKMSQRSHIDKILEKFGLVDCNPAKTPMEKGLQMSLDDGKRTEKPYRELLGSLMYLMLSVRPDICYHVGYMGRFQQQPSETHWQVLKRIVRYLKGTKNLKLVYKKADCAELIGYADADWASDTLDRKSVSGFVFFVYGCPVSWGSRKQAVVATSSSEAEYIALSQAIAEVLWIRGVLIDLKITTAQSPVLMYEDNAGCIGMAKNAESKRSKHIDIKHHFIRDHITNGNVKLEHISTQKQLADIFTKSLDYGRFKQLYANLNLCD